MRNETVEISKSFVDPRIFKKSKPIDLVIPGAHEKLNSNCNMSLKLHKKCNEHSFGLIFVLSNLFAKK